MILESPNSLDENVQRVYIAEMRTATSGILKATLGSCVAIALIHRRAGICGLAHCFLPFAPAGFASKGARYADHAARNLLLKVAPNPAGRRGLHAFIAGGGRLLTQDAGSRLQVGQMNVDAARASLNELRIRFTEVNIGGFEGCSAKLDCDSFSFSSEKISTAFSANKEAPWK